MHKDQFFAKMVLSNLRHLCQFATSKIDIAQMRIKFIILLTANNLNFIIELKIGVLSINLLNYKIKYLF